MRVETIELTLNHVDLGHLSEFALMTLCGVAQCHAITAGRNITIRDIVDAEGRALYPGFFWTHLKVPPAAGLARYRVWDTVALAVDVRLYAGLVLDSTYTLAPPGEAGGPPERWRSSELPSVRGGTMFVVDGAGAESIPSAPRPTLLAELPRSSRPPDSMDRFSNVQKIGRMNGVLAGQLAPASPILYPVSVGRDLVPGRALMFATFVKIMDWAERRLLLDHTWPAFPADLVDCFHVLERETCFIANCYSEDVVQVDIRASLEPAPSDARGFSPEIVPVGIFVADFELFDRHRRGLLVASRVKKVITVPAAKKRLVQESERLIARHRRPAARPGVEA